MTVRAALMVLILLAGCLDAGPGPAGRQHGESWTSVEADLWFTHVVGCSMCGPFGGTQPQASVLAVYRDGSLLWYSFAMGPENLTFAPGLAPWYDEVLAVHHVQRDNWSQDMHYVVDVHTSRAASWPAAHERLLDLHGRLEDPGPDDRSDCADCGGPYVHAFDPDVHAALFQNDEEDGPWGLLLDEFAAWRQQVDDERAARPS